MPKVSVLMPSYNHGRYIAGAIQSVLDQTYQDWELVITDDGSTDDTLAVARSFMDPRIKVFDMGRNTGGPLANANCIANSTGEYFAMLSSDDEFLPHKLAAQVAYMDAHPDAMAVLGYARLIDENGAEMPRSDHNYFEPLKDIPTDRYGWLRRFFLEGNCLVHPTALTRRALYTEIFPPDPRFPRTGDLARWIRTALVGDIHVIEEDLIKFRMLGAGANASGNRAEVRVSTTWEFVFLLDSFLGIKAAADFRRVFPDSRYNDKLTDELVPFAIAMEALGVSTDHTYHHSYVIFAVSTLQRVMSDRALAGNIERAFGFTYREFMALKGRADISNIEKLRDLQEKADQIWKSLQWELDARKQAQSAHELAAAQLHECNTQMLGIKSSRAYRSGSAMVDAIRSVWKIPLIPFIVLRELMRKGGS